MAPRRGGGGYSSGGSSISASCPGAFTGTYGKENVVYFASSCLFFALFLGLTISLCCVRKGKARLAKKIIGVFFVLSLLCMLLAYALDIIATLLRECGTTDYLSYFNWVIALNIFWRIGTYLLLVVVLWVINSALRERVGPGDRVLKVAGPVILGIMFCLTAAYIGISSYNTWTNTTEGFDSNARPKTRTAAQLAVAYWVLYLVSVVAAGGLSVTTLLSTNSRHLSSTKLLATVIAIDACMFVWVIIALIGSGANLEGKYLGTQANEALAYIENFFQLFAYIAIVVLGGSRDWGNTVGVNPNAPVYQNPTYQPGPIQYGQMPPQQQQYAYNSHPGQQPYYHQQQPEYNGTPVAEVK